MWDLLAAAHRPSVYGSRASEPPEAQQLWLPDLAAACGVLVSLRIEPMSPALYVDFNHQSSGKRSHTNFLVLCGRILKVPGALINIVICRLEKNLCT